MLGTFSCSDAGLQAGDAWPSGIANLSRIVAWLRPCVLRCGAHAQLEFAFKTPNNVTSVWAPGISLVGLGSGFCAGTPVKACVPVARVDVRLLHQAMLSRCLNLWLESVFQSMMQKRAEPIAVRNPLLAQYMSLTKAPDSTLPESSTRVHYLPGLWPELFLDMSGWRPRIYKAAPRVLALASN